MDRVSSIQHRGSDGRNGERAGRPGGEPSHPHDGSQRRDVPVDRRRGCFRSALVSDRDSVVALVRGFLEDRCAEGASVCGAPRRLCVDVRADLVRSEPDAAALALYLASAEGESLSGLIFDADQSASNY